jgi:hypothetical protein
MNKVGSLYQVKKYYWMLFPNKETTVDVYNNGGTSLSPSPPTNWSGIYTHRDDYNVTFLSMGEVVVFLEKSGKYKKVLTSNGEIAWTWIQSEFYDSFEEVRA